VLLEVSSIQISEETDTRRFYKILPFYAWLPGKQPPIVLLFM